MVETYLEVLRSIRYRTPFVFGVLIFVVIGFAYAPHAFAKYGPPTTPDYGYAGDEVYGPYTFSGSDSQLGTVVYDFSSDAGDNVVGSDHHFAITTAERHCEQAGYAECNMLVYDYNSCPGGDIIGACYNFTVYGYSHSDADSPNYLSTKFTNGGDIEPYIIYAVTATLTASPTSIQSGQSSTLTWSSQNADTCTIDNGVGSVTPAGGGTRTVTPAVTTTYTLTCTGGQWDDVASASDQATVTVTAVNKPDLISSAITPSVITLGVPTTLTSTITNQGPTATGASFHNIYEIDPVGTPASIAQILADGGSVVLASGDPLAALAGNGAHANITTSYTFPTGGTWWVRACADMNTSGTGAISEIDEGNNCGPANGTSGWTQVTVTGPDLTATYTGVTSATVNTSVNLSALVQNIGTVSTGVGFPDLVEINPNTIPINFASIQTLRTPSNDPSPALNPGRTFSPTYAYSFPSTGTWYVQLCGDAAVNGNGILNNGAIVESDEGNNCSGWQAVQVTAAQPPTCSPSSQTILAGANASWTAAGGNGTYTWYDANSNTLLGSGSPFSYPYANQGNYAVYVKSNGVKSANCNVTVNPTNFCSSPVSNTITAALSRVATGTVDQISWVAQGVPAGRACTVSGLNIGGIGVNSIATGLSNANCYLNGNSGASNPEIDTQSTYTITCSGAAPASVTVDVVPVIQEN